MVKGLNFWENALNLRVKSLQFSVKDLIHFHGKRPNFKVKKLNLIIHFDVKIGPFWKTAIYQRETVN